MSLPPTSPEKEKDSTLTTLENKAVQNGTISQVIRRKKWINYSYYWRVLATGLTEQNTRRHCLTLPLQLGLASHPSASCEMLIVLPG